MDLPIRDVHGVSLVAFALRREFALDIVDLEATAVFSLVLVVLEGRVLLGFHLSRRQWELPGGTLEAGGGFHDEGSGRLDGAARPSPVSLRDTSSPAKCGRGEAGGRLASPTQSDPHTRSPLGAARATEDIPPT